MQIWAGLGNPGAHYALNRHNAGFMAVDAVAETHDFGAGQKKFSGWVHDGWIGRERILLLKPATFMNESGRCVAEAMRFYRLTPQDLTVFHDELDLLPMKIKVKRGGSAAGHNGLRSIDRHIGPDFRRVRIGIGHPGHKDQVAGYVLSNYARNEMEPLATMLGALAAQAHWLAAGNDGSFMNDVALATAKQPM